MRTVAKTVVAAVVGAAALLLAGPAPAHDRPERSIVVRAVDVPSFAGPTQECPAYSLTLPARSLTGRTIGSFEFCFFTFTTDPATEVDHATGIATFDLPGGEIRTTLTLLDVPTATGVSQTDTGTIFEGTGIYRGATGSMAASCSITFDPDGTPHPDATLTLTLGHDLAIPISWVDTATAVAVGSPPILQSTDSGSGRARLLGRFTLTAGEQLDLSTGAVTGGHFTLNGVHGQSISGTYSGVALPDLSGYLVSGPITGGTGRFRGARGFVVWRGAVDPPGSFTFDDVVTGWIGAPALPDEDGER